MEHSRAKSLASIGLTIALITVSAWITVPIGPVPFTLQMLSLVFVLVALRPREAVAAVYGYELLGALGLPVFSGIRGGIGILLGPTGGFLWGYLIAMPLAAWLLALIRKNPKWSQGKLSAAADVIAGILFTAVAYCCGWVFFMTVMGVGPEAAFFTAITPFIIPDIIKIFVAVACARAVRQALRQEEAAPRPLTPPTP